MKLTRSIKNAMEAGTDSTLPEYGLREIVHTLAQSLREYRKYAWETLCS